MIKANCRVTLVQHTPHVKRSLLGGGGGGRNSEGGRGSDEMTTLGHRRDFFHDTFFYVWDASIDRGSKCRRSHRAMLWVRCKSKRKKDKETGKRQESGYRRRNIERKKERNKGKGVPRKMSMIKTTKNSNNAKKNDTKHPSHVSATAHGANGRGFVCAFFCSIPSRFTGWAVRRKCDG